MQQSSAQMRFCVTIKASMLLALCMPRNVAGFVPAVLAPRLSAHRVLFGNQRLYPLICFEIHPRGPKWSAEWSAPRHSVHACVECYLLLAVTR